MITVHLHTTLQRRIPEGLQRRLQLTLPAASCLADVLDRLAIPLRPIRSLYLCGQGVTGGPSGPQAWPARPASDSIGLEREGKSEEAAMVETGASKKPRAMTFRQALDAEKARLGRDLTGPELEEVRTQTILGLLLQELADEMELDREAGINS